MELLLSFFERPVSKRYRSMHRFMKKGVHERRNIMKKYKNVIALLLISALIIAIVPAAAAEEVKKININQAPAEELVQLKGVGAAYADRIVQFREANGSFASPEDIMKVPGIGNKIFQANKDSITVE